MLAALPWYDLPEVRGATDALWRGLAAALRELGVEGVPEQVERGAHYYEVLAAPELLFTQTCGYDVVAGWGDRVQVVATPCYLAPGCDGAEHRSFVVVAAKGAERIEELRGATCAVNSPTSHSGCNALRAVTAPHAAGGRFFARVEVTGSHVASLQAVVAGGADVAAIDCVTWELLRRHRPALIGAARILCETPAVPAPPFVTARPHGRETVAALRLALHAVCADPALARARGELLLGDTQVLPARAYERIAEIERGARGATELGRLTPEVYEADASDARRRPENCQRAAGSKKLR